MKSERFFRWLVGAGCTVEYGKGSHRKVTGPTGVSTVVALHGDIGPRMVARVCKQVGIKRF